MNYDHILKLSDNLKEEHFHLSCGFHDKTYFLFEDANFYVAIHCKGTFEFRNADNKQLIKEIKAMAEFIKKEGLKKLRLNQWIAVAAVIWMF